MTDRGEEDKEVERRRKIQEQVRRRRRRESDMLKEKEEKGIWKTKNPEGEKRRQERRKTKAMGNY